ncbi:MAG: tetratricopeptide repeat protein [Chloroflexota bacterium]
MQTPEWMKNLKIGWGWIAGVIVAISGLIAFVSTLREDWQLGFVIAGAVFIAMLIFVCGYVILAKQEQSILVSGGVPRMMPRFSKGRRTAAGIGLGVLVIGVIVIFGIPRSRTYIAEVFVGTHPTLAEVVGCVPAEEDETLIIIANFQGVEPERYQVTEQIIRELRQSLADNEAVQIYALNQEISEQQGAEYAQEIGESCHATLVFWGSYGVTDTDVLMTIHVESFLPESISLSNDDQVQLQAEIAELNSFSLQISLSQELAAFSFFVNGLVQYDQKNYTLAVSHFNQALSSESSGRKLFTRQGIFFYLGNAQCFINNLEQAIADYTEAIEIYPLFAEAYNNRGVVYSDLGDYEQAIADYTKAIALDPQFAYAYSNRGVAYAGLGDYMQAISDYTQAIELDPQDATAYYNRGLAYADLGDYEPAIADYTQAIELDPQDAEAYNNRGFAYYWLGDYDQAIADYTKAIALDPQYANAYYDRGLAHYWLGDSDQAIADYTKAIALDPQYSNAYYNRGNVYADLGDYEQAIADYTQAIELDPQDAEAYNNRGLAYYWLGDYEQAIADYTQAIELDPLFAAAYANRGVAYRATGDYEQAIADDTQAIELDPQYAVAYTNRGLAYYRLGDYDQAIADYTKAIELNPQFATAYGARGVAYNVTGDLEAALEDFRQFLELDPSSANRELMEGWIAEIEKQLSE